MGDDRDEADDKTIGPHTKAHFKNLSQTGLSEELLARMTDAVAQQLKEHHPIELLATTFYTISHVLETEGFIDGISFHAREVKTKEKEEETQ